MSETSEPKERAEKKPLKLSQPGRLELKKTVESGQVRQSFSHGRSKTVAVEVKRKRTYRQTETGLMTEVKPGTVAPEPAAPEPAKAPVAAPAGRPQRTLTKGELEARERALEAARVHQDETPPSSMPSAAQDLDGRAETAGETVVPDLMETPEEAERRRIEEENRRRQAEEAARLAALQPDQDGADGAAATGHARLRRGEAAATEEAEDGQTRAKTGRGAGDRGRQRTRTQQAKRRSGKLTISQALADDGGERQRSVAAMRRRQQRERQRTQGQFNIGDARKIVREAVIPESITVGEFANRVAERATDVIKVLMKMGIMATINQAIDQDTAELVAGEMGHKIKRISAADVEIGIGGDPEDDDDRLLPRAPVVTIMGHVDHGKTSLLDALRQTDVVAGEAGGITQHIGAYQVSLANGGRITFLDTPGHEAFTAMRQRGAEVTDIVVLIVAADDGVQPQTVEAVNHAKAAGVPIIVAINKMDKPGVDATRVKNELLKYEIIPEDLGGDTQCVEVSALKKTGLENLEEAILLQAEVLELKSNPDRQAYGTIIEAKLERGRGPVATVLVQRGTLRIGDVFIAGSEWGRVRALINDHGDAVDEAGPSQPIEVLGLNGAPLAGQDFAVVRDEARAREIADYRQQLARDQRAAAGARGTLEQMFDQIKAGAAHEVPLVVKADVQGSVEAIANALDKMATEEVKVNMLHAAVGGITESDVSLAAASSGIIIGFNVRANAQARDQAKRDQVDIRYYSVIYNVIDDVRKLMEGKLAPSIRETRLGAAEVREVFSISKLGKVAGCLVTDGVVRRGAKVRLLRDDMVVHEGSLATLRHFKEDVREVQKGSECGMSFERYDNIEVGDQIECYEEEQVARTL